MTENEEKIREVMNTLSTIAPSGEDEPRPASEALGSFYKRTASPMKKNYEGRVWAVLQRRNALATVLAFVLLIVAVSIPGVRAAASDILGLFRVQKFAALSVSPEQLALLGEIASSGLYPGEIELLHPPGDPLEADSLDEATAAYGRQVRLPADLGKPDSVYNIDGGNGRLIINVESARAILAAAGANEDLIPDSLEGKPVAVTIFDALAARWTDDFYLVQSPSPLVDYPEDVDVAAIGEAVLQALGLSPSEAAELAGTIDWTNTLLLPIPENVAQFEEARVDGVTGLALSSLDGDQAALLWERDGIVYALSGGDADRLVRIANSMP